MERILFKNSQSTTKFSKNDKQAFKLFQNFGEFFCEVKNCLKFFNNLQKIENPSEN